MMKFPKIISSQSKVVVIEDQVSSDFMDGDKVILNIKDGQYFKLNPVGARIWNLIQDPKTVNEVVETLLQEYEVSPELCEGEVIGLLQKLLDQRLIIVDEDRRR